MTTLSPFQAHKAKWGKCTRCPLHQGRDRVVLCRGKLPCDILFVGEAPGQSENVLGQPFVGPAGKLLDKMIEEGVICASLGAGIEGFPRIAFTNVIACIPYDEDGEKISEPPPIAIKKCSPRLVEIIEIAKPRAIVCVGKVAEKHIRTSINGNWQGEVITITHPAAILRADPANQGLMYQKNVVALSELFESL